MFFEKIYNIYPNGAWGQLQVILTDDGEWERVYFHYDGLGSVVALTDERGRVVAEYDYSPFGRITDIKGGQAKKNVFTYTGREYDPDSGLTYFRTRYGDLRILREIEFLASQAGLAGLRSISPVVEDVLPVE